MNSLMARVGEIGYTISSLLFALSPDLIVAAVAHEIIGVFDSTGSGIVLCFSSLAPITFFVYCYCWPGVSRF